MLFLPDYCRPTFVPGGGDRIAPLDELINL